LETAFGVAEQQVGRRNSLLLVRGVATREIRGPHDYPARVPGLASGSGLS